MRFKDEMRANPLNHVNVLRWISVGDGKYTSATVRNWAQINPENTAMYYTVFDPETGQHNRANDPSQEISRVLEIEIERETARRIYSGELTPNEDETDD